MSIFRTHILNLFSLIFITVISTGCFVYKKNIWSKEYVESNIRVGMSREEIDKQILPLVEKGEVICDMNDSVMICTAKGDEVTFIKSALFMPMATNGDVLTINFDSDRKVSKVVYKR